MENKELTESQKYEKEFFAVIENYCKNKNKLVQHKVTLAIVSAHQTGQDLVPTLEAKELKDLADLLQDFQKKWESERPKWSYSLLVWANVQNLFDHIAKKFNNHGKESE